MSVKKKIESIIPKRISDYPILIGVVSLFGTFFWLIQNDAEYANQITQYSVYSIAIGLIWKIVLSIMNNTKVVET